ncbi:MAG: PleD family two-component system response regulator [Promethearchaeota archaeon]
MDPEKTKEMKRYEEITGKFAIWRGLVTEGFKKWQKGEKIYEQDKERITILVPDEKKNKWNDFAEKNDYTSISKMIREAVDTFIDSRLKHKSMKGVLEITHGLKEPLTLIKGFSQIILENYKDDLKWDVLTKINDIFDQSLILESRIKEISEQVQDDEVQYDVLIIEDDTSTIKVLANFFEIKGHTYKILMNGADAINEIIRSNPKIILLDILLPDIDGFEICKQIKSIETLKNNKVFYITAIPGDEVEARMIETKADGYFLKPFDFGQFNKLLQFLK